jgi:hypothetical protein
LAQAENAWIQEYYTTPKVNDRRKRGEEVANFVFYGTEKLIDARPM